MSDKPTISICLGNYGSYNAGYLLDRWVDLPTDNLSTVMHEMQTEAERLCGTPCEEFYISDFDGYPFNARSIFNEYTSIEDMNLLAKVMRALPWQTELIQKILDSGFDEPSSVFGLINWIVQAEKIAFFPYEILEGYDPDRMSENEKYALTSLMYRDWFRSLVEEGMDDYFDLERYGEAYSQDVYLMEDGYLLACFNMPDEERYDRQDTEDLFG